MNAKTYLLQIYNLNKKIDSRLEERDEIMSTLTKAVDTTNEPIYNTGTTSDPTGNTVLKLMQFNDRVNKEVDELVSLKIKIAGEINQLEKDNHRMVLKQRYLHCKKFEEIAVEQKYAYRHITRLHGQALQEFESMFKDVLTCP